MAPLKKLKGTLTSAEFKELRKAIDQVGIKDPAAEKRNILVELPLREFKETVLGAVFRKIVSRINYEDSMAGLLYTWYKAGGEDAQFKFDEALVGLYLNETPSQLSTEPPRKKAKTSPTNEDQMITAGTASSLTMASTPPNEFPAALTGKRYEWCWAHIINEYLNVTDIFALIGTDKTLKGIVEDFLKLEINRSFIAKYPIQHHTGMYSALGQFVKFLTLTSLDHNTVESVFGKFPNLAELTMNDIRSLNLMAVVPQHLRKLTVFNCPFESKFIMTGIRRMCENLTWLHFAIGPGGWYSTQSDCTPLLGHLVQSAKQLRYLHVENVEEVLLDKYDLRCLEHLRIESVRKLQFDSVWNETKRYPFSSLERLEISYAEEPVRANLDFTFPKLKFLKMRFSPDDPKISNLSLKVVLHLLPGEDWLFRYRDKLCGRKYRGVDLQIIDYRSEEERRRLNPSGVNACETVDYSANATPIEDEFIFGRLNDDCLRKIISYLRIGDCLSLASLHEHLRRVFRENSPSRERIAITGALTKRFPIEQMESAYDCVFQNLAGLQMSRFKARDALAILSRCAQLKHLALESLSLGQSEAIGQLPTHLESLAVRNLELDQGLWIKWCRRLNKTLRVLDISRMYHEGKEYQVWHRIKVAGLGQLKHIREFRFTGTTMPLNLKKFLTDNLNSLEHLQLVATPDHQLYGHQVRPLAGLFPLMARLRVLNTGGFKDLDCYPDAFPLPHVTDLTSDDLAIQFAPIAENVKTLRLRPCRRHFDFFGVDEESIGAEEMQSYRNLENLHYYYYDGDLDFLQTMQSLRHLSISSRPTDPWEEMCNVTTPPRPSEEEIMEIIQALPQINRLSIITKAKRPRIYSFGFKSRLEAYLESERRAFRFNNVVFDGQGSSKIVADDPLLAEDDEEEDTRDKVRDCRRNYYKYNQYAMYDSEVSEDSGASDYNSECSEDY